MTNFRIDIQGKGGHGAVPDETVDPLLIGAHIVTAAQSIVSRETRPDEPVVLSFCTFQAGTTCNIIPDTAKLLGTTRATQMETLNRMRRSLERVATGLAQSMHGQARLTEEETYPPVHNNPALLDLVREVGGELLGPENVLETEGQRMTSEDFSFYLEDQGGVPGVIFGLGVGTDAGLHNPHFDFGSAALEPGIMLLCNIALQFLQRNGNGRLQMTNDK
jgi:amidohydrolase